MPAPVHGAGLYLPNLYQFKIVVIPDNTSLTTIPDQMMKRLFSVLPHKIAACNFFFLFLLIQIDNCFAQPSHQQIIEDSIIGWQSMRSKTVQLKPHNYLGRTFTVKQQENMNTVTDWVQQTYTPVGGIGTFKNIIYASKDSYAPHAYGVDLRVWNVSFSPQYLDANGHFKPVDEEYTRFGVTANVIPGSFPLFFMNKPDRYLFVWQPDGYRSTEQLEARSKNIDPRIHPNVYKYLTRINALHTVFLVPGNKLPIVEVTKGEYLQLAEESLETELLNEKERIDNQWPGDDSRNKKSRDDAFSYVQKRVEGYRTNIVRLQEKYRNTMNEQAVINHMQPTMADFHGADDPFTFNQAARELKNYYPVYKIEPAVMEKCKSDQPQWISVSFPYETKEDGNQLYELYRTLTEHFNYDYAFDYFFNPEKVKGKAYKPLNEELLKSTLEGYRKKTQPQRRDEAVALPAGVYFMDDFRSNADGSKPAGWFFSTLGKFSEVLTVKGKPGKWVRLGYNNPLSAPAMKKPLPENFTLEYDVVTDDFTSRTGGSVVLYFSSLPLRSDGREDINGNGTTISVNIISGNVADYNNNNYSGTARVEIHTSPAVNRENNVEGILSTYALTEFTNKKNRVHLTLKINEGELKLLVNNKQVAVSSGFKMTYGKPCVSCNINAGTAFNTVYWKNTTNDADNVGVYISNVKIVKD